MLVKTLNNKENLSLNKNKETIKEEPFEVYPAQVVFHNVEGKDKYVEEVTIRNCTLKKIRVKIT